MVANEINTDTRWTLENSPYLLSGEVVLSNAAVLTVDPGVSIYMGENANFTVQGGVLKAVGSALAPIRVLSEKSRLGGVAAPGDWMQWVFTPGASGSQLQYVNFEHGKGIRVTGAAVSFHNVKVTSQLGAAIVADHAAVLTGTGNSATGNTINAILLPAGVITSSVRLGLKGIPYFVESGVLSVGIPPEITSITNLAVEQGRSATYEVTGKRLAGLSRLSFDKPNLVSRVTSANENQVRFELDVPLNESTGPVKMNMLVDAGEVSLANAFSVVHRQAKLNNVLPGRVVVGQGPQTLNLTGDTFSTSSQVLLNLMPLATQWIDERHLQAVLPDQLLPGNLPIRVQTPRDGDPTQSVVTDALQLLVDAQPLAFAPSNLSIQKGQSQNLVLRLAYPASRDTEIKLTSSVPNVVSVPASVMIAAGSQEKIIGLSGSAGGVSVVTASQEGFIAVSAQIAVEVPMAARLDPSPLILGPDQKDHLIQLSLTRADTIPHSFSLSIENPAIASLGSTHVSIPAGQLSVALAVKGLTQGYTQLHAVSETLGEIVIPIYINSDYQAMSALQSPLLGVYVPGGPYVGRTDITGTVISTPLGVFFDQVGARKEDSRYFIFSSPLSVRFGAANDGKSEYGELLSGAYQLAVGPVVSAAEGVLQQGKTTTLRVSGANLATVSQISASPSAGIQFGVPVIASDGLSFTVPVIVATDASAGLRKFTVSTPTGVVQESQSGVLRLMINP